MTPNQNAHAQSRSLLARFIHFDLGVEALIGVIGGALFAALALAFAASQPRTFPIDDAYIHLSYGRSLAFSGTFGLNPGEPSLGTSSPLWVLLLAPLFWIFRSPYWSIHVVSWLSAAGYIVIGTRFLARALSQLALSALERRAIVALCAVLLAANGSLLWMSLSGMETCLVVFLCFASIAAYSRFGPGVRTGVLLGLSLLGRTTSLAVVVAVVLFELLRRRRMRPLVAMLVTTGLVYTPYALYSLHITGSAFPTTAQGKLLTYIHGGFFPEEWPHYWGRIAAIHQFLMAYPILAIAMIFGGIVLWQSRPTRNSKRSEPQRERWTKLALPWHDAFGPLVILGLWALFHVGQYTLAFRTIGQQGRYIAEWLAALAVIGAFAVGYCVSLIPNRGRLLLPLVIGGVHLASLPYWASVYRGNLAQVQTTYVAMAKFIRETTPPDARIASFDIGTIRYLGDRYTLDLGGLVDTSTHPCLKARSCGEYVREHAVDYVMYPKDPDSDKLTGVQKSVTGQGHLLREVLVKNLIADDYAAPTLTHSFRLELFRIDGWFDRHRPGDAALAFREEPPNAEMPMIPTQFNPGGDFEILGYRTDVGNVITYVREYPYTFTLWLSYRALKPLVKPKWLHVLLFDDEGRSAVFLVEDLPTAGALLPSNWPVGEILEEHRVIDLPYDLPHSTYHLFVSITDEHYIDVRYPELYPWVDCGTMRMQRSKTTALSPN